MRERKEREGRRGYQSVSSMLHEREKDRREVERERVCVCVRE